MSQGWLQGSNASKKDGELCYWGDPKAHCFCLWGALMRAAKDLKVFEQLGGGNIYHEALLAITHQLNEAGSIWRWNDTPGRRQSDVVALLDEAKHIVTH